MADEGERATSLQADMADEGASTPLTIVGVGVGAPSLPSLAELFTRLGPDAEAAYLIAVRQNDGPGVEAVMEALERASSLPVKLAADGERLAVRTIYVGASDDLITLEDGHLRTRSSTEAEGRRGALDSLLISLAEHAHERAVAVLLSGLGSEGAAGLVATKKFGGLSIAEANDGDPDVHGGSDPGAVADLHLPSNRIAAEIAKYIRNLKPILQDEERDEEGGEVEAKITQVATILRNVTGHDFHGYKRGTFLRRIARRVQVMQIAGGLDAYIDRLRSDREEVQNLFQDLLIGVTQFFRDPAEFETLERELPRLFETKGADDHFRIWVLGCATGEEAYSLTILLREHMATLDHPPQVQIFATDLDARALSLARAGRYADTIASHIRPDRLERWFTREGDTYCVSKELREMCIFSPHNIIKDAPFSRIDVLSCRNLLIYLSTDLQNRVIPIFHFALRSDGVLFLGSSENVTRHQKLFTPVDRKSRVFRRLETATRIVPDFPLGPRPRRGGDAVTVPLSSAPYEGRLPASVGRQAEAVAERYAPAYVVVDSHGDVLHFSGRTGRYLEPSAGAASLNLVGLVHRDLRLDVRSALQRGVAESRRIEVPRLTARQDDRAISVNLIVEPLSKGDVTSLIVVFQDLGQAPEDGLGDGERLATDEHVQRLEADLKITRDRLQATIEELESTNEELKSSNEEYQSINEELQSANEEMETSKEELQSVNEELQTVNGELAHRVHELGHSNSDLKNLLEATQIATVFLDNDLRVRNFTPAATDIFHLLETDIGRPLDHVVSRVQYPELLEDVRGVLKTLTAVERQVVENNTGRQFAARVLPYRSLDNYINGAVVTFTDLTAVHQAEAALRESEGRFRAFVTASSDAVYRMSPDWTEMRFLNGRGFMADIEAPSDRWMERYILPEERGKVRVEIDRAVAAKALFALEHRVVTVSGDPGWTFSRAVPILNEAGEIVEWFGAATDITELREATEALREAERRQQVLIEGVPQLVWRAVEGGDWTWASPQWSTYTGQPERESHGSGWLETVHPDDREGARAAWTEAAEHGGFDVEHRIRHAGEGEYRWFRTRAVPVRDDQGAIIEWLGTSTDVDELRALQERQKVLVAELQHRTRNLLGVVRSIGDKTARASADLEDFRARFRDRLDALSRVQGLLSRLNEHERVTFDELIRTELSALDGASERVTLDGPAGVRLRSSMVQTLALALHELATNAVKYGALGQPGARLAVSWSLERDGPKNQPWLHVEWKESDVVMPSPGDGADRRGQGRELIERALPYQLSARTSYSLGPDGVHCTLSIPVSETTLDGDGT